MIENFDPPERSNNPETTIVLTTLPPLCWSQNYSFQLSSASAHPMLVQSCVLLKQNDSIFIYMFMFHPATHTLAMCQQKQTQCTAGAQGNNYSTDAPAVVSAQLIGAWT